MDILNATDVRKKWSVTLDSVVHEKPVYLKRTHDNIAMLNIDTLNGLLSAYHYYADTFGEEDGSVTLSAKDLDLVVNEKNEALAKRALASEIKEYAEEYYNEFQIWSAAPNRRGHIPFVLKALSLNEQDIERDIICQNGRS